MATDYFFDFFIQKSFGNTCSSQVRGAPTGRGGCSHGKRGCSHGKRGSAHWEEGGVLGRKGIFFFQKSMILPTLRASTLPLFPWEHPLWGRKSDVINGIFFFCKKVTKNHFLVENNPKSKKKKRFFGGSWLGGQK